MALAKGKKRVLSYVAILGGLAVLSLTFFTVSQFEKAKCDASTSTLTMCENKLNKLVTAYKKEKGMDKSAEVDMAAFIEDDNSSYRDAAKYWYSNVNYFKKETNRNSVAYKVTAIPAYICSMATLVAFGLILKHAEKAKEKEDEEAVKR